MKKKASLISWENNRPKPGADTVILVLHGMNCSALTISALIEKIEDEFPAAELLVPSVPLKWNKFVDLTELSREISEHLAGAIRDDYIKSAIIVGHSAGGVLAQSVCLDLLEDKTLDFGSKTLRLVLIAPLTKGWAINHHLPLLQKVSWIIGIQCSKFLRLFERGRAFVFRSKRRPMWILQLQRGSQFVVGLRLRWLKAKVGENARVGNLVTYVLLGSVDEIVSWRDMIDDVVAGGNIHYRQIGFSNHADVVNVDETLETEEALKAHCRNRAKMILSALTDPPEAGEQFEPWDDPPAPVNPNVERVVFVIHGIRDEGHWTQKIAARARQHFEPRESGEGEKKKGEIAVETSSYGFFSMLEFLNPVARQKKIHWLMDEYVEAKRRYPNARFSFIGHSNGTYLLAQALKDYPGVEFERIAFAGCVVTSFFEWKPLIDRGQVKTVMNFTGNKDWVVSLFPRAAQILPPLRLFGKNLGGAAVVSFEKSDSVWTEGYLDGAHGVAIEENNWDNLARFAVSNLEPPPRPSKSPWYDPAQYEKDPKWYFGRVWGRFTTPIVLAAIVALILGFGWLAWSNPFLFWLVSAGAAILGFLLIAAYSSRADGVSFERRRRILRQSDKMFFALLGLIGIWLLLPLAVQLFSSAFGLLEGNPSGWSPAILDYWKNGFGDALGGLGQEFLGAIRMTSLGFYAIGLYKVLTGV